MPGSCQAAATAHWGRPTVNNEAQRNERGIIQERPPYIHSQESHFWGSDRRVAWAAARGLVASGSRLGRRSLAPGECGKARAGGGATSAAKPGKRKPGGRHGGCGAAVAPLWAAESPPGPRGRARRPEAAASRAWGPWHLALPPAQSLCCCRRGWWLAKPLPRFTFHPPPPPGHSLLILGSLR